LSHTENLVLDSSKIESYLTCPRQYFFRYGLHWVSPDPSIHLEFGSAWHRAKRALLLGWTQERAMELFEEHYRQYFPPETDLLNAPKNPGNAAIALQEYVEQFRTENQLLEVLFTEVTGEVMLEPGLDVAFKIDAIVRDRSGLVWVLDHKTGSRLDSTWTQEWELSFQMWLYTHALCCMYEPQNVGGALVDGSIFRKMGNAHIRVPVRYTEQKHISMYQDVLHTCRRIHQSHEQDYFQREPTGCTMWMRMCPYYHYCNSFYGCESLRTVQPEGMVVREWNPLEEAPDKDFHLTIDTHGQSKLTPLVGDLT